MFDKNFLKLISKKLKQKSDQNTFENLKAASIPGNINFLTTGAARRGAALAKGSSSIDIILAVWFSGLLSFSWTNLNPSLLTDKFFL